MSVFDKHIQATGLPEGATAPALASLTSALDLTVGANEKIARVNAAKDSDPNSAEVRDATWRAEAAKGNDEFVADEKEYQRLVQESEAILARMRENATKYIKPLLTDDEKSALKKEIASSRDAIVKARETAAAQAQMLDAMLELNGAGIEGGIMSLIPELDSLKGSRGGRKSTGGASNYATRANEITVNGKTTNRMAGERFKGSFEFAAAAISDLFHANEIPENKVTAEELEESYYASRGKSIREDKDDIPESHTWEFTRDFFKKNDKGEKVPAPETLKMTHTKWTQEGIPAPAADKKATKK